MRSKRRGSAVKEKTKRSRREVVMLVAYFDESGTHSGSLVTAVAGYVSTAPRWKRFAREWTEALGKANVDCFHMSEYESRKGVFADWSDKKRVAVIKRL